MIAQDQNPVHTLLVNAAGVTALVGDERIPLDLGNAELAEELAALREQAPEAAAQRTSAVEFADPDQHNTTVTVPADEVGVIMEPDLDLDFPNLAGVPVNLLPRVAAITTAVFD